MVQMPAILLVLIGVLSACTMSSVSRPKECWRDNGKSETGTFCVNGDRPSDFTGTWLTWYPNCQKQTQTGFRKGKAHGLHYLWDKEGNLIRQGEYWNDNSHGAWLFWDADHQLRFIRVQEDGHIIRQIHFDRAKIIADGEYIGDRPWSGSFLSPGKQLVVVSYENGKQVPEVPDHTASPKQIKLLKAFVDDRVTGEQIASFIQDPKNQEIAIEAVTILKDNIFEYGRVSNGWYGLASYLELRACGPVKYDSKCMITNDGSYLSGFARVILDRHRMYLSRPRQYSYTNQHAVGLRILLAYLGAHPEDIDFRMSASELAREYARVSDGRNDEELELSWRMLLATGDIYAGMPISDAIKILGPPLKSSNNELLWHGNPAMHSYPVLSAKLHGEEVAEFSMGN